MLLAIELGFIGLSRLMAKPLPIQEPIRRPGSGCRPIPSDVYLRRWNSVVEMLKAGHSVAEIKRTHGICSETVRHVRRFMTEGGWSPPARINPPRPAPEPRPPKVGMTMVERLEKYPNVVFSLRAGRTMKQVAALEDVSVNTVRVVRRALTSQGEEL